MVMPSSVVVVAHLMRSLLVHHIDVRLLLLLMIGKVRMVIVVILA